MFHVKHLLLAGLLLAPTLAQAQVPVTLTLQVEDVMLLVQTLGAIGCQNVQQLIVCEQARDLRKKIQDQVKLQGQ